MSKPKGMTPEQEAAWNAKEKARKAALYLRKKEQYDAANAKWRAENREKMREYSAKYKATNPERVKASMEKHLAANHERVLARSKAYYEKAKVESPEKLRLHRALVAQNRRAAKQATGGKLKYGTISKLKTLQRNRCACCHDSIESGYHIDHIMPLALGGEHSAENIQLLCRTCNLTKSAKHPVDFMQQRGYLL